MTIVVFSALTLTPAGIDFSSQIMTSVDIRFWRLKSIPAL